MKLGRELILYQNHVHIAIRNIITHKTFSLITIFGLSTSIAACILIFQYTSFELSFDKHNPNAANIYRVNTLTYKNGILRNESALSPFNLSEAQQYVNGIRSSTEFGTAQWWFTCSFTYRNGSATRTFNEKNVAYATPEAVAMFNLKIKSGKRAGALVEPFTAVISETTAIKYFGDEDPIGKVLHLRGSDDIHDYTVTAIMEDQPVNTHYRNDILLSFSSKDIDDYRKRINTYGYVQIDNNSSLPEIQKGLSEFAAKQPSPPDTKFDIRLERISDIHQYSKADDQFNTTPDVIYLLMAIAFIVLALAWVNYVNLSIARSFSRAKEVGVRKTIGATYKQITNQFLTETFLYNIISIIIAISLVITCAPWFYEFVGIKFPWDKIYWLDLGSITWMVITIFIGGMFISGFLPARLMASTSAIRILKGKIVDRKNNGTFRRLSIVIQFACAIALVMTVMTFNRQFNVMKSTNVGVDFERTMIVLAPADADSAFRSRLSHLRSSLQNYSIADKVFTGGLLFENGEGWLAGMSNQKDDNDRQDYYVNIIDPGFIEGYGLKLLAGRNFEVTDYPQGRFFSKVEPIIINKTGAKRLGYVNPEEAIEQVVYWDGNECRIIGVIEDYHQRSVKLAMGPAVYTVNNGPLLCVQLSEGATGENLTETAAIIQREWDRIFPDNAFDYFMLSDHYESLYSAEKQLKNVFTFFCILAIVISCLGLFALSLFSVNKRSKEMSIRKVLGAPSRHLANLLMREYLLMVIIAGTVALPVTAWAMERWLATFAIRVNIDASYVTFPIVVVLIFSLLSIGIQTLRVIRKNPTENLKAE